MKDFLTSQFKDAIPDLKEIDTLLTEIRKTTDGLTKSGLAGIEKQSFSIAGKYGKSAADYLQAVRDAAGAGYKNAADIAELSLAAQNAGGITAELANQYISAADNAYRLGGSVEKLTAILDGASAISSGNAVSMAELAEGMSLAGEYTASLGLGADEATAALATVIAATGQGGTEAAQSLKAILLNTQQIADEGQGIDGGGLARYADACRALNVSLEETKDGASSLRGPMAILKDLSQAYAALAPGDSRKASLLDSLGSAQGAQALDAVLSNFGMYEKMLQEYTYGTGALAEQAELTANSWEGSLNRLSNTWADTVGSLVDSDAVIAIVNSLNGVLSVINGITKALGPLGTAGLGAGLFASFKNVGRDKTSSPIVLNMPTAS